jgi:hypothetical protein
MLMSHDPKKNEIDVNQIDLEKMREKTTSEPGLLPYAHTAGGAVIRPEDKGKIKGRAVAAMHQQTEQQMAQLYQQMQLLAEQASAIKKRVEISERIYLAEIPFEPLIGHTYFLYRKQDKDVLSMIGPKEWGRSKKKFSEYVATIRMLADHTWEILDKSETTP